MIDNDFTPEQRAELGDVRPLYERLKQHEIPEPDSARLLATLKPLLAEQHVIDSEVVPEAVDRRGFQDWLQMAWSQTRLFEAPFWSSSILLTLIGLLWGMSYGSAATTLWLLFLSPLIAVGGVAYIFRPATRTLWELERLSHYKPFELLYARVMVILLLNIVLATVLLLTAWTQGLQIILWRLLLIWFGPMIGLMGVTLFCSVRWSAFAGLVVSIITWGAILLVGWRETILTAQFETPTITALVNQALTSNTLLIIAFAGLVGGILLLYESGRQAAR